jgi:hypothetical protein
MRERVRERRHVMTLHADEQMQADELTVYDIERCILTGQVVERQGDRMTSESKYVVRGEDLAGSKVVVVVKLGPNGTLVILTTYLP